MEMTFYGHFVAGANQVSIQPQIERLRAFGVKAILDYSAEEDISTDDAAKLDEELVKYFFNIKYRNESVSVNSLNVNFTPVSWSFKIVEM